VTNRKKTRGDMTLSTSDGAFVGAMVNPGAMAPEPGTSTGETEISLQPGGLIICYSRCLYCGRRTPHEACHAHASKLNPNFMFEGAGPNSQEELWATNFNKEPEACSDKNCPVWEPYERERFDPWYTAWLREREDVQVSMHEAWVKSMRGQGYADHPLEAECPGPPACDTPLGQPCHHEGPYGRCHSKVERHHPNMVPWEALSLADRITSMPRGLDRAFKAGYEAAAREGA
jgi:hypothetical protein